MELLQLRYFCALAESQHLSNTAKKLMIAPPSLSLTISKLEAELGVKLFNREKRTIYLNENGRLFYSKIKQSLELMDKSVNMESVFPGISIKLPGYPAGLHGNFSG